ncbi:MAG: hypothetical protein WKG00_32215 [Polyangiaceae bacterium]
MGKMLFGMRETLVCLQNIEQRSPDGEPLCLAYKTTGYFVVAGVYFRDDGYTLALRSEDRFIDVPPEALQALQAEGALPTPLPAYSVPLHEYAFGYSLWLVVALVIAWGAIEKVVKRRRREREDAAPATLGPPALRTEADRFVDAQVRPLLRPGEVVQHQAYTLSGEPTGTGFGATMKSAAAPAHFVALTDQRLIFLETRQGAFGPLLENAGVETIERRDITEAFRTGRSIVVHAEGPLARMLWVHSTGKLSNQHAFMRDVARLLEAGVTATAPASSPASTAA